jgi:U-box domain-containing protein 5
MTVNFASARLQTQISCNKVSVDGLEVANLISSDIQRRNAGFLAEAFVIPPVNITLSFPCAVDIHKIVVIGQLGSQKSVEFQLYTAVSDRDTLSVDKFDRGIFHQVGRCYSPQKPFVCFTNKRYRPRDFQLVIPALGPELDSLGDGVVHEQLYHRIDEHLSRVRALTLSVTRTANGSAAAVKRFEVWGQPAQGTSNDLLRQLKQNSRSELESPASPPSSPPPEHKSVSSAEPETVDIPSEFLDAITCELMSVPILLPCGMSVDRATLDRHIASEACWGRPPSDPFTGRSFGDRHKPVVHSSLKARLDRFVTLNCGRLPSVPGLLGSGDSSVGLSSSRLVNSSKHSSATAPEDKEPVSATATCNDSISARESSICYDETVEISTKITGETSQSSRVVTATRPIRPQFPTVRRDAVKPGVHRLPTMAMGALQSRVRDCRRRAIETGKGARCDAEGPALKRPLVGTSLDDGHVSGTHMQTLGCNNCNQINSLYKLPCVHHVCRQCLLHVKQCPLCGVSFETCDPVRVHY